MESMKAILILKEKEIKTMSENKETKQEVNKLMVDDYDIIVTG